MKWEKARKPLSNGRKWEVSHRSTWHLQLLWYFSFLCKVAYQGMRPHALDRKRTAFSILLSYQLKLLSQWTHFTRKLNMQKLEPKVTSKYTFFWGCLNHQPDIPACRVSSQADFILNYFLSNFLKFPKKNPQISSNFLSNSQFPPIPTGRLEQLKSPWFSQCLAWE